MVVVDDIGVCHSFVHFPIVPQQVQQVCRLFTDGKQFVAVFGKESGELFQLPNLKTFVLCEHSAFKCTVLVKFKMVNDGFSQCLTFIVKTLFIKEDEIVLLLVTNARLTLNMQRELKHRLAVRFFASEPWQRTAKCFKVEVIDGIFEPTEPILHLILIYILCAVVITISLNEMLFLFQPFLWHIVKLVIPFVYQLVLVGDIAQLEFSVRIQVFVC